MEDTQTLRDTPHKQHKAWLYDEGATTGAAADDTGATSGAAAERRKLNSQAVSNVRKKAKAADKSGEPVRESLAVRALLAGIHLGPLGEGPERLKAQNAFSQEVRRAEQTVLKRDALNASQKAYAQVTIYACVFVLHVLYTPLGVRRRPMCMYCALLHRTPVRLAVGSRPHNPN